MRLDCPLCGAVVHDEERPPSPGRCHTCGARFEGGGERPQEAAATALAAFGVDGDADGLVRALFSDDRVGEGVAITSDRREAFYAWWLFVADGADDLLRELAAGRS